MDVGAIAFYRHEDRFKDILKHIGTSDKAFDLTEAEFEEKYGYSLQSVFHTLYQSDDMWGFVARKVNKRDGSTAYKLVSEKDTMREVPASDIYFALKMTDYDYSHWAEMDSPFSLQSSYKSGSRIIKNPTQTVKKNAEKQDMKVINNVLYQIVKTQASKWDNYYGTSSFNNTQWLDKEPYFLDPMKQMMKRPYINPQVMKANPFAPNPTPWQNYVSNRPSLHAIPFSRDNIKPHSFQVIQHTKAFKSQLRVFVNFPNGIPVKIG